MTLTATVFHGTADEIQEFSHDFLGKNTANNAGAFYFTSDKEVAFDYSREAYYRKYEWEEEYRDKERKLIADSKKQQHIYECEVSFENPLILDIEEIERVDQYGCKRGMNILDSVKVCALVNIMQHRQFERYMDFDIDEVISTEELYHYFENEIYNEETGEYEYEEKPEYDGIIIRNAIDNMTEIYLPSDVYVVLNPQQIRIKNRLTE